MRKLKVVSLTHGGIQNSTGRQRYSKLFDHPDIDLTLVVPDKWYDYKRTVNPDPALPGTKVLIEKIRFNHFPKVEWYLHYYPKLRSILEKIQPDVIHLWEEPWAIVSIQAALLRNTYFRNAAIVLETDQNIIRKLPVPFQQIRKYMLNQTDLLIGRCDEALDVSRHWGYKGSTSIVEYGVERINFLPHNRQQAAEKYNVKHFTVGYVGRIVSYKGLDDVLDAMVKCNHQIYLNIMGSGPDQNKLTARIRSLGLNDQVKLFDSQPAHEVAQFMKSIDVLVLMSRTTKTWKEQFGRVIMEAHACGTPVIGSDSGSIPSVIGPGGWVIKEGDSTALANLFDRLYENPNEMRAAGESGLHQADTRFNFDVISNALLQSYQKAARQRAMRLELHKL